jgi:hypothetical protein
MFATVKAGTTIGFASGARGHMLMATASTDTSPLKPKRFTFNRRFENPATSQPFRLLRFSQRLFSAGSQEWLSRATMVLSQHWEARNSHIAKWQES